jgi:TRAP-type uncharacterized transport system fused permease subunit
MFVFYYAVMSALTPPVAVAAYAASSIAEDNPLLIAVMAVKFARAALIVPFAIVYGPELLMIGPWYLITISFITAVIGLIFMAAGLEAHLHKPLVKWERLFLVVVGLGFIVPNLYTGFVSLISICIYFIILYYNKKSIF